jgi:hypothetical protein
MTKPISIFFGLPSACAAGMARLRSSGAPRRPTAWPLLFAAALAGCTDGHAATEVQAANGDAGAMSVPAAVNGGRPATMAAATPSTPPSGVARVEVSQSLERSCREICDRSRRLNCENVAKCMPNCLAMGSLTPCTAEVSSFYDCLVSQPPQNWSCAPDGVAAIRAGYCDKEQGETVACMEAKMQ